MTDKKLKTLIETIPKYKKGDKVWIISNRCCYKRIKPLQLKIIKIDEINLLPLLDILYLVKSGRENLYYNEKHLFKTQKEVQKECDKMNKEKKEDNIRNLIKQIENNTKELAKITK